MVLLAGLDVSNTVYRHNFIEVQQLFRATSAYRLPYREPTPLQLQLEGIIVKAKDGSTSATCDADGTVIAPGLQDNAADWHHVSLKFTLSPCNQKCFKASMCVYATGILTISLGMHSIMPKTSQNVYATLLKAFQFSEIVTKDILQHVLFHHLRSNIGTCQKQNTTFGVSGISSNSLGLRVGVNTKKTGDSAVVVSAKPRSLGSVTCTVYRVDPGHHAKSLNDGMTLQLTCKQKPSHIVNVSGMKKVSTLYKLGVLQHYSSGAFVITGIKCADDVLHIIQSCLNSRLKHDTDTLVLHTQRSLLSE